MDKIGVFVACYLSFQSSYSNKKNPCTHKTHNILNGVKFVRHAAWLLHQNYKHFLAFFGGGGGGGVFVPLFLQLSLQMSRKILYGNCFTVHISHLCILSFAFTMKVSGKPFFRPRLVCYELIVFNSILHGLDWIRLHFIPFLLSFHLENSLLLELIELIIVLYATVKAEEQKEKRKKGIHTNQLTCNIICQMFEPNRARCAHSATFTNEVT